MRARWDGTRVPMEPRTRGYGDGVGLHDVCACKAIAQCVRQTGSGKVPTRWTLASLRFGWPPLDARCYACDWGPTTNGKEAGIALRDVPSPCGRAAMAEKSARAICAAA